MYVHIHKPHKHTSLYDDDATHIQIHSQHAPACCGGGGGNITNCVCACRERAEARIVIYIGLWMLLTVNAVVILGDGEIAVPALAAATLPEWRALARASVTAVISANLSYHKCARAHGHSKRVIAQNRDCASEFVCVRSIAIARWSCKGYMKQTTAVCDRALLLCAEHCSVSTGLDLCRAFRVRSWCEFVYNTILPEHIW